MPPTASADTSATRPRFRVNLNCPTPLAQPEMEIEADFEEDARRQFMEANGISGSDCPWTIERT